MIYDWAWESDLRTLAVLVARVLHGVLGEGIFTLPLTLPLE